jgi:hypothetical protein
MKKIALVAMGALVGLTACVDAPTGLAPEAAAENRISAMNGGATQVNGPVWVDIAFSIAGGSAVSAGVNLHPQAGAAAGGSCRKADGTISLTTTENTVWFNQAGVRKTAAKFCQGSAGGVARACSAQVAATYAAAANSPGTGNENLNFLTEDEGDVVDLFVHYKANQDWTDARGTLEFEFACDTGSGDAELDLEQFIKLSGSAFQTGTDRQLDTTDVFLSTDLGAGVLTSLSWIFRSRVGA